MKKYLLVLAITISTLAACHDPYGGDVNSQLFKTEDINYKNYSIGGDVKCASCPIDTDMLVYIVEKGYDVSSSVWSSNGPIAMGPFKATGVPLYDDRDYEMQVELGMPGGLLKKKAVDIEKGDETELTITIEVE